MIRRHEKITLNLIKYSTKNYFNYPCPRNLREIMMMSLIEKENPEKIKKIWSEYHNDKPRCFADIVDGKLMKNILTK
jgi:hypothetical protein